MLTSGANIHHQPRPDLLDCDPGPGQLSGLDSPIRRERDDRRPLPADRQSSPSRTGRIRPVLEEPAASGGSRRGFTTLLADKGYSSAALCQACGERGTGPIIPKPATAGVRGRRTL